MSGEPYKVKVPDVYSVEGTFLCIFLFCYHVSVYSLFKTLSIGLSVSRIHHDALLIKTVFPMDSWIMENRLHGIMYRSVNHASFICSFK